MLRLGLCCQFQDQPIRFRTATATHLGKLTRIAALAKLSVLCLENAAALHAALEYCAAHEIGCFRINSQILPLKTHPRAGYDVAELPAAAEIVRRFEKCGAFARAHGLRTAFHPDQFIVLSSPRADVVRASVAELDYQAGVCEWLGGDVINIHGGGAYGDKPAALDRFRAVLATVPARVRARLTVENDDRTYTPADMLPVCRAEGVPLVYDVHHHRCNPDGLSVEDATAAAIATWDREPLFHLSSPLHGWAGPDPRPHHDFIDVRDLPACWRGLSITVEIEAKAKEVAIARLLPVVRAFTRSPASSPRAAHRGRTARRR
jgi:UV DNA damage endonuclease